MKILIISDTHGKNDTYLELIEQENPLDMVIHCGDIEGSEYLMAEAAGCPIQMVTGNNDFFSDLPAEKEFQIGKYKIWLTHGHTYYVSMNNEYIKREAKARGVDIVMYGHTHRPVLDVEADLITLNPGSLTYPRQEGRKPSYILMEVDESGEAHFTLKYLP